MAVETPQLEEPVYQPTQQQAAAATTPMPTGQEAQTLPASAGFVSKAGAGAYVANSILQGWLKGRQLAAQRNMMLAQRKLGTMKSIYDDQAQKFQNVAAQKGESSPEALQAKETMTAAWNNYVQTQAQYAMPEQPQKGKGGKGGKGGGFKGAMGSWAGQAFGKGGVTPQLFPQLAIQAAMNNPPGAYLTPQARQAEAAAQQAELGVKTTTAALPGVQAQAETAQLTLAGEKAKAQTRTEYDALLKLGDKVTPAQVQQRDIDERILGLATEEQQQANTIRDKYLKGEKLTDQERNFAYAKKIIEGPQTIQYNDGLTTYLSTVSPDGKILSKVKLGRVFHEDAASIAVREAAGLHRLRVNELMKTGMTQSDAEKATSVEESKNPAITAEFIGNNPVESEKRLNATSKALETLWNNAGGAGATTAQRQAAQAAMSNFVTGEPKGAGHYMLFRQQLAGPTGTEGSLWWKKPVYAGKIDEATLKSQQAALYEQFRETLQAQNPTWSQAEIDAAAPDWLKSPDATPATAAAATTRTTQQSQPATVTPTDILSAQKWSPYPQATTRTMSALPQSGAQGATGRQIPTMGKPGRGKILYYVGTADGGANAYLTADDAKYLQSQGTEVTPVK